MRPTEDQLNDLSDADLRTVALRILTDAVSAFTEHLNEHGDTTTDHHRLDPSPVYQAAERIGDLLADPAAFSLDTLVVNHYLPGEQVRPHKDPPRWEPLVLGVTLCEALDAVSTMQFAVGDDKHRIVTPHRSAYVFYGRAYTDATHARLPSKQQHGAVWSLTFRAIRAGAAAE